MSAIDVLGMPSKTEDAKTSGLVRADPKVVSDLLDKCKTPAQVMQVARKLRFEGGWREEFALYGEAAKKFPEYDERFKLAQQDMATQRKVHTFTAMEQAGREMPRNEELLRIEPDVQG